MLELDEHTGLRDYNVKYETRANVSDAYMGKKAAGGNFVSGEGPYIEYMKAPGSDKGYYYLFMYYDQYNVSCDISDTALKLFKSLVEKYDREYVYSKIANKCIDLLYNNSAAYDFDFLKKEITDYISENSDKTGLKKFCQMLPDIGNKRIDIYGFTYSINEICSENELLIIKSHCINKKKFKMSNDDIEDCVEQAVKVRCAYFRYKYYSKQQASLIIGKEAETQCSMNEMNEYVSAYKRNNIRNDNDEFNKIIYGIEDRFTHEYPFFQLKQSCTRSEILLIQYLCVKASDNNESDVVMMNPEYAAVCTYRQDPIKICRRHISSLRLSL